MVKTLTPDRTRSAKPDAAALLIPRTWEDFSHVYPIYDALTRQLELPGGPYPAGAKFGNWNDKKARERDLRWLDQMDSLIQAVHLRHFLVTPAVAREDGLRLFLQRNLAKPEKLDTDRDKIDLLLVQYFMLCAPQEMIAAQIEDSDVAGILEPVLGAVEVGSLPEVCEPLDRVLELAQGCHNLREFMEQGLLEQGKLVKVSVGELFYDPSAMVAICRFNFMLRRFFIQLLHGDLRAVGAALTQLEKRGVKAVDCRRAGFSSKESLVKLRQFHEHWKPPFKNDYSKGSAFQPYEQLMCLREDLEEALGPAVDVPLPAPVDIEPEPEPEPEIAPPPKSKPVQAAKPAVSASPKAAAPAKPAAPAPAAKSAAPAKPAAPAKVAAPAKPAAPVAAKPAVAGKAAPAAPQAPARPAALQPPAAAEEQEPPDATAVDVESLEEKVWEQLISTPPTRGRSMTTVTVDNARILLSAWEVAAFVSESGLDSEELRKLIVARALLSTSIERRKRLMDFKVLHQALAHARAEIPRFQERVDQLKRTMKTDGAVNLGISLKRLLSLVEEAEQLQKGSDPKKEKR
jgi:hypothetical protein